MSSPAPSRPSRATEAAFPRWRPLGVPKRVLTAAVLILLTASCALALELDATADTRAVPTPGARIVTAGTGEIDPLPALPAGARPFATAGAPRFDGRLPALATPEPPPPPAPEQSAPPVDARNIWDRLADCESGDWDRNGRPVAGTARWDLRPGAHIFEGGLQFHPRTWDAFAPGVLDAPPAAAYEATREQQIAVAEAVLDAQGWGAWPACAKKLGLLG